MEVKKIFDHIQMLNPRTEYALGYDYVSEQAQQVSAALAQELVQYLPESSLAYRILHETSRFSVKQLWVIAYQLQKNEDYCQHLEAELAEIERNEALRRRIRRERRARRAARKAEAQKAAEAQPVEEQPAAVEAQPAAEAQPAQSRRATKAKAQRATRTTAAREQAPVWDWGSW